MKELKIVFVPAQINKNTGSYRIWVDDYNKYFNQIGIDSKIVPLNLLSEKIVNESDVIILGKSMRNNLKSAYFSLKKVKNSLIVGAITPPRDFNIPFDFVMAGSLEERDSLSFHKNVILNAHIESLYHNSEIKTHTKSNVLKICYHGWTPHLYSFTCGLKNAIEKFNKDVQKVELHVITEYDKNTIQWDESFGRPNVDITFKKWKIENVKDDILECDIGICPGVYDLTNQDIIVNNTHGKFNTDYIMRYKNKTNNGRAIVFMQLGIPTIADFSPSNFHLFGDMQCGLVAHTEEGWYSALEYYSNYENRNMIAKNARDFIDEKYDPLVWAKRYYDNILKIKGN